MLRHKIFFSCLLVFTLVYIGCSTTEIVNIDQKYIPITPYTIKLNASVSDYRNDEPIIKIKVNQLLKCAKVYRIFSRTSATAFTKAMANSVMINGKHPSTESSTTYRDSVNYSDTSYAYNEPFELEDVNVENISNNKKQKYETDNEGNINIDIRKFIDDKVDEGNLNIRISFASEINNDSLQPNFKVLDNYYFGQTNSESQSSYYQLSNIFYVYPCNIAIDSNIVIRIKKYENEAKKLAESATLKIKQKEYFEADNNFKKLFSKYPFSNAAVDLKNAYEDFLTSHRNALDNEIMKRISLVSNLKVPHYTDQAGLTADELDVLAQRLRSLTDFRIVKIMQDGMGFLLNKEELIKKYKALNISQQIYCLLYSAESLGGDKANQIEISLGGLNNIIAQKLAKIKSNNLLK